jgi:hypothetical protein
MSHSNWPRLHVDYAMPRGIGLYAAACDAHLELSPNESMARAAAGRNYRRIGESLHPTKPSTASNMDREQQLRVLGAGDNCPTTVLLIVTRTDLKVPSFNTGSSVQRRARKNRGFIVDAHTIVRLGIGLLLPTGGRFPGLWGTRRMRKRHRQMPGSLSRPGAHGHSEAGFQRLRPSFAIESE